MTYSYATHSKQGDYFSLVFINDTEDAQFTVRFLPNISLPFRDDHIQLSHIKMRVPEMILYTLEEYGLTIITQGLL